MTESVGLMFSGGVDSIVCLSELVKQGLIPKLFLFQTWKMKDSHVKQIKRNAKRLSPKSQIYVFKPRTIDYIGSWRERCDSKKFYDVAMDEYGHNFFCPLELVDKLVIGYVDHEVRGKRKDGEIGLAQPTLMNYAIQYKYPLMFPLRGKTTREVDEMFKQLPKEVQENTVSSTRAYKFGGAYLSG
jgi:hypothetical protein